MWKVEYCFFFRMMRRLYSSRIILILTFSLFKGSLSAVATDGTNIPVQRINDCEIMVL